MQHELGTGAPSTFVIASSAHAAALRKRLSSDPAVVVFSETDSLDAMRLMMDRPPKLMALDPAFVRTARGALLVSRLKAHAGVDLRVLAEDASSLPLLLARPELALHAASLPLEGCGTRAARRFPMKPEHEVVVDGERSRLINLSVTGAQVLLPARVQPRQRVRFTLLDESAGARFGAMVAWSSVELAQSAVRYRAGISFIDPDTPLIEAFCIHHTASA